MAERRDYGRVTGYSAPIINVDTIQYSQVFKATHNGEGIKLPSLYRSFISFSFGGKDIEDFNLIAYCNGDRMQRSGYSDFEDLVTNYDIMDGQYYHGTHFKPFSLSLDLVTDGIDQKQLDEFLYWFRGGMTRELILAEHPNRAIMARVASAPQLQVLPFEKPIQVQIGTNTYNTSTTVYRGDIQLEFVADLPFWYAKTNIFRSDPTTGDVLFGGIGMLSDEKARLDALKVIYEDNIPSVDLVSTTMHFGTDLYALIGSDVVFTKIAGPYNPSSPTTRPDNWDSLIQQTGYWTVTVNNTTQYWCGARTYDNKILGRIAGTVFDEEEHIIMDEIVPSNTSYQFFYGGTAPSPTILSFTVNLMPIQPSSGSTNYINCIASSYYKKNSKEYSSITIESEHKKVFEITTPNVITSWNKAYKMIYGISTNASTGTNWSDLSDNLRDYIRHPAVRTFAIQILSYLSNKSVNVNGQYLNVNTGIFTSAGRTKCLELFKRFFQKFDIESNTWSGEYSDASFVFNAELGTAEGTFQYWQSSSSNINIATIIDSNPSSDLINANFKTHIENVGDMLHSNWLIIEDQNKLNNGLVRSWASNAKTNAHRVYHDLRAPITHFKIEYKNMYL